MTVLWLHVLPVWLSLLYTPGGVNGQDVGKLLAAGDAAMSNSHYASAISQYTAALAIDAAVALIYNKRAAAYSAQGNHRNALRDYEQAINLDPSSPGSRLNRAKLHRSMCIFDQAERDVRHVLETRPQHKGANIELGRVAKAQQSLQTAQAQSGRDLKRRALAELLDIAPLCSPAKLVEAEMLLEDGDWGGVVLMTGQVLKLDASSVPALLLRGRAYNELGDLEVAKRHFSEALRSDPDHRQAKLLFKGLKQLQRHKEEAEAAAGRGDHARAEAEFMEALAIEGASGVITSALWLQLCRSRLRLQKPEAAKEACGTAQARLPDDEDALVQKVKALILSQKFGEAFAEASSARQRFRNSQQVYQVLREAEKAQKLAERKQYYDILKVASDAGDLEIKRAYRELARRFHPDKAASEGITTEAAHERFTEISEAYEVLSDPEQRAAYDRGDDVQLGAGQAGFHSGGFPGAFPGGFPGGTQFRQTFHFG